MFDADDDCVEELIECDGSQTVRRRTISACLFDRDGEAELKITINPSASSLFEPSEASRGFSQSLFGIDWNFANTSEIIERRTVKTTRLDTLLADRTDIGTPDFLSLDTQGCEYEIITGAVETIERGVVGLVAEVGFLNTYAGAKGFGDVADLLNKLGFHFCGFLNFNQAFASCQPIGLRGDGFPIQADAIFLRRVEEIPDDQHLMAAKLAFVSLIFGFLDYTIAVITRFRGKIFSASSENWMSVLRELSEAARQQPSIFLPRFPDIFRAEQRERFGKDPNVTHWPAMMDFGEWLAVHEQRYGSLDAVFALLLSPRDSPIEHVLRRNGFGALADKVNIRRRDECFKLQNLIVASAFSDNTSAES